MLLTIFLSNIKAGFPSPADDYIEKSLDLNELIIKHPSSTFFVRVEGDSMCNAGIQSGDLLVVDRSLTPTNRKIIIAIINGEFTVKRLCLKENQIMLVPENSKYKPIKIDSNTDFQVWGVVTYVIHQT